MSKTKNKNSKKNMMASIFILGIGFIVGFFLTVGNYTAQTKLIKSFEDVPNIVKYEGRIAQCSNGKDSCIKIGSGGQIEKLE